MLKIGLVGYSDKKFDKDFATRLVNIGLLTAVNENLKDHRPEEIFIVSGLTNIGIPALGYSFAKAIGWKTVGIACSKASEYDCFPVDERIIVGSEWGDESETFLNYIDALVRVGGGKQSLKEEELAKQKGLPVYAYELPLKDS